MKAIVIFDKIKNVLKNFGRDIVIIFLSVMMAFAIDRAYENYDENEKLEKAMQNFYYEAKLDVNFAHQNRNISNIDSTIKRIEMVLDDPNISLNDLEKEKPLYIFNAFNLSLEYIKSNTALVLNKELQYGFSEVYSGFSELKSICEEISLSKRNKDYFEVGEKAKIIKLQQIARYNYFRLRVKRYAEDIDEIEKILKKQEIIK